tara:strand:- start:29 stop:718 length:690 start_codon:yes stop_codon:yes gene_type:complete
MEKYARGHEALMEVDALGAETEGRLQLKAGVRDLRGAGMRSASRASAVNTFQMDVRVKLHAFPAPTPPRNARCETRTQHVISVAWDHPVSWGGAALASYELQCREVTLKGEAKDWEAQYTGSGAKTHSSLHLTAYKIEVRVRAYNVASARPSEWSEVLKLGSPKEEEAALAVQKLARGNTSRKSMPSMKSMDNAAATASSGKEKKATRRCARTPPRRLDGGRDDCGRGR